MKLSGMVAMACIFAGATFILNTLITHWWGQTAGVSTEAQPLPIGGFALLAIGILVMLAGRRLLGDGATAAGVSDAAAKSAPEKRRKVVLYEHGPDQPY